MVPSENFGILDYGLSKADITSVARLDSARSQVKARRIYAPDRRRVYKRAQNN